jgi:hypothetical protein
VRNVSQETPWKLKLNPRKTFLGFPKHRHHPQQPTEHCKRGKMESKFYQYPDPLEGPDVPYKTKSESNPVLRGKLLQIGASL